MHKKIYIESTVWYQMVNYKTSEFKERALQLFDLINRESYDIYISNVVLEEIALNTKRYRNKLEELIKKFKPIVIVQNEEAKNIAEAYLENTYRKKKRNESIIDALHAAIATASNISYIVSFNYVNLLNVNFISQLNAVNVLAGYNNYLSILPPFMFLDLDHYEGDKGTVNNKIWEIKNKYGTKMEKQFSLTLKQQKSRIQKFTNTAVKKLGLKTLEIKSPYY